MKTKKVNILGTDYTIIYASEKDKPKLDDVGASGLAELYSKELIINTDTTENPDKCSFDSLGLFQNKVVRHEIIHAFFHESGLINYESDEVLVDWIAVQLPKIFKAVKEVECDE